MPQNLKYNQLSFQLQHQMQLNLSLNQFSFHLQKRINQHNLKKKKKKDKKEKMEKMEKMEKEDKKIKLKHSNLIPNQFWLLMQLDPLSLQLLFPMEPSLSLSQLRFQL